MSHESWVLRKTRPLKTHDSRLTTMMKTLITLVLITLLLTLIPELASAQPGLPTSPEQVPIDGGLALLAAAGGGYAIKKLRERKN